MPSPEPKPEADRKPVVEPIHVPKATELLATRLRDLILSGRFGEGQMLPTERELVEDSGLSRSSVREALRVLEAEGLIQTKAGRSGGSMVKLPGRGTVARSMELFVKSHDIRLESLLQCRVAVEPFLAGLAALNRTEEDLERMRALHRDFAASEDDVAAYKRLNLEWHLAVARASGNEILIVLMESIAQPILEAAAYQEVTTPEIRQEAIRAHAAILRAIEAGEAVSARLRMEKHLTAYANVASRELLRK